MNKRSSDVILKNLLDGVLIVNKQGKIIYANQAAQRLFSKSPEELIGKHFGFPVTPFEVHEIEIISDDNIRTAQMLATNIRWNNTDACLLSIRDITELRQVSRELESQKVQLQRSNAELEQYAYMASHDLKEPLRKIFIYIDILMRNKSVEAMHDVKNYLSRIYASADRMKSLVSGIAEFSVLSAPSSPYSTVDLNDIVNEVLKDLDELIEEKNAKIDVEDLPTVEAIRIQMHQLFLNLISNAIKYSHKEVRPEIQVKQQTNDADVKICVEDNGIGFEEIYADKIFQPFQRLHSNYEGSGIGLAICKKIVEQHGGSFKVFSKPGEGSKFHFTLSKERLPHTI